MVSSARARVQSVAVRGAVRAATLTSHQRVLPTFLIVGAQRCGTTSMFHYLIEQRQVVAPILRRKGVHYFDTFYDRGWRWYRAHFPTRAYLRLVERNTGHAAVTGEASPYYLFHPLAPRRIATDLPDVKLIVLLRDPVMRAYSHYVHMRFEGLEDAPSFEEALRLEPERTAGEEQRLLDGAVSVSNAHQHHTYVARGQYAQQIERLQALFPPEQLLVLDSDAVFVDPAAAVATVLAFLGVDGRVRLERPKPFNAGSYESLRPDTRRWLADQFAESNGRLADLLPFVPSWV